MRVQQRIPIRPSTVMWIFQRTEGELEAMADEHDLLQMGSIFAASVAASRVPSSSVKTHSLVDVHEYQLLVGLIASQYRVAAAAINLTSSPSDYSRFVAEKLAMQSTASGTRRLMGRGARGASSAGVDGETHSVTEGRPPVPAQSQAWKGTGAAGAQSAARNSFPAPVVGQVPCVCGRVG